MFRMVVIIPRRSGSPAQAAGYPVSTPAVFVRSGCTL